MGRGFSVIALKIAGSLDAATQSPTMKMKGVPMPAARRAASRKIAGRFAVPARLEQLRSDAFAAARSARTAVIARAAEARASTRQAVSRLEHVFERRVSRAIAILGVPSARDVRALSRQVAELQQSVEKLRRTRARA